MGFLSRDRQRYRVYGLLGSLTAIALILSTTLIAPASAQQTKTAFEQLSAQEQTTLQNGRATVTGSNGQFTGRVLVNASAESAWQVLTDYNNFAQFFPNVESSRLLESNGNRRVFEQVNVVRVFPITRRTRVVIATTESQPRQIDFRLVEGDLSTMQGTWRIDPVASSPNQVLVTHQVRVEPEGNASIRGVFYGIYRDALQDTLVAIKQESELRARR